MTVRPQFYYFSSKVTTYLRRVCLKVLLVRMESRKNSWIQRFPHINRKGSNDTIRVMGRREPIDGAFPPSHVRAFEVQLIELILSLEN